MKKIIQFILIIVLTVFIGSNVIRALEKFNVVMISHQMDFEGPSFSSNAWEGLKEFGERNSLEEGQGGYENKPNLTEADYFTAFRQAMEEEYDLIIGVGTQTKETLEEYAIENPNQQFLLIDDEIELDNVASATFKDYEAAYLAGLAAASETQTDKIGFIGGLDTGIINEFELGFTAGAKEINPDIEVEAEYLEWFTDSNQAYEMALEMYNNDTDIIFHAAGGAGTGVFQAAREVKADNVDNEIWVIGADYDQTMEGTFEIEGEEYSLTLTSTLKHVGKVVDELTQLSLEGNLKNKTYDFGMTEGGVDISAGQLSGDTYELVEDYRNQMQSGELDITETVFE